MTAVSDQQLKQQLRQKMQLFDRVKYYPLASILGFGFATANRFIELLGYNTPLWLKICQAAFTGLYGFFCAVIYGFTPRIVNIYKAHYHDLKQKRKNKQTATTGTGTAGDSTSINANEETKLKNNDESVNEKKKKAASSKHQNIGVGNDLDAGASDL